MNVVVFVGDSGGVPVYGVEVDEKVAMFPEAQSAFLYVAGRQLLHRQLRNVYLVDMQDASSPPEWWDDFAERFIPRKFWYMLRPIAPPPPGTPVLSNDGAPPPGGANWVSHKTRREAGHSFLVREQPSEDGDGTSVLHIERDGEPLGSFMDDRDWTEAMTYIAARQILTDSPGSVWMQPWGYPAPYPFVMFDSQYMPYDLVETMKAIPQLGGGW